MAEQATQPTEAEQIIAEQAELIASLTAENKALKGAPAKSPSIEVDGKEYAVKTADFHYKGKKYSAADLIADEALQAELVGKQVGFLVEVVNGVTEEK